MLQLEGVTMDQLNAINAVVELKEKVQELREEFEWSSDDSTLIADAEQAIDNLLPWSMYERPTPAEAPAT
jgi:hypothetical protein